MALRFVLLLLLCVIIARAFWRVVDSFVEGLTGRPVDRSRPRVPEQGVTMVRDPVCGTFVLPERAIALSDGPTRVFFCSTACRDKYRTRQGRTA